MVYVNELYHHGIKGQRWGVRRYQNPDGTLTVEGKARYFKENGRLNKKGIAEERKLAKAIQTEWINPYNKAADRQNEFLEKINKRYDADDLGYDEELDSYTTDKGKQYVKEVAENWEKVYTEELKKYYPASLEVGYDYLQYIPLYKIHFSNDVP